MAWEQLPNASELKCCKKKSEDTSSLEFRIQLKRRFQIQDWEVWDKLSSQKQHLREQVNYPRNEI